MSYNQVPPTSPLSPAPKSKVIAGILGILLGSLGVHNFYLGRVGLGLTQLLITVISLGFLSWVSAIWGIVEGILILTSTPGSKWHVDGNGFELSDS